MRKLILVSLQDKKRESFVYGYELIGCESSDVRSLFPEQTDVYYSCDKFTMEVSKIL